ncbi:MAG: universal stress protein [Acidobacteriota bacterium]|nr:MAG: universal stress protein [Acidobacteriota bacterium]
MTILVAVDLSDVTRKMLAFVRGIAREAAHKVFIVHVAEPEPEFVGWEAGPGVVRDQVAKEFQREHAEVESMAVELRAEGVDATGLLVQGPTIATILDEVERRGADLLVVGSHGHGAAYDLAIGSISAGLIRKASLPVLVVPDR